MLMELTEQLQYCLPPFLEPVVCHVKYSSMQFPVLLRSLLASDRLSDKRFTASRLFARR